MPIQNVILNTSNGVNNPEDNLVLVRSEVLYYLKFINYDKDLFKSSSKLTSKPSITVYTEDSQKKVIIDYTLANETDKKYIKSFFANMTQIDTFTLTNGDYIDVSESEADISSSLTFTDYKENKIFALVNSITNENTAIEVYNGEYFTQTPQLTKSGSLGSSAFTENYSLALLNPSISKNFTSMGVIVGDVIEILYENSKNHGIKYEVEEITHINEKQILKLKKYKNYVLPFEESLIGKPVVLNVYINNFEKVTDLPEINNSVIGCCYNTDKSVIISNQTEYQCKVRNTEYTFTNKDCDSITTTETSNAPQDIFAYVIQNKNPISILSSVLLKQTGPNYETFTLSIKKGNLNVLPNLTLLMISNNLYEIDQSDSSNKNNLILFSTSKDTLIPYRNGIFGVVTADRIGSKTYVMLPPNTPQLYLWLEGLNKYTGYSIITS